MREGELLISIAQHIRPEAAEEREASIANFHHSSSVRRHVAAAGAVKIATIQAVLERWRRRGLPASLTSPKLRRQHLTVESATSRLLPAHLTSPRDPNKPPPFVPAVVMAAAYQRGAVQAYFLMWVEHVRLMGLRTRYR